jgi:hypothetical protein
MAHTHKPKVFARAYSKVKLVNISLQGYKSNKPNMRDSQL